MHCHVTDVLVPLGDFHLTLHVLYIEPHSGMVEAGHSLKMEREERKVKKAKMALIWILTMASRES